MAGRWPGVRRDGTERGPHLRFSAWRKDNFVADRDAAARLLEVLPGSAQACRANRDFLQRAVRYLSAAGIRQYIDIGSGLPTAGNTREVAHEADPDARVAYADYDPQVLVHARALLETSPAVAVIPGDLRKPGDILAHPGGLLAVVAVTRTSMARS